MALITPFIYIVLQKKTGAAVKPKTGVASSKFTAFRAQMRKQKEEAAVAPGSPSVETIKVFDAGFFKVSSPVKSTPPHCEGRTLLTVDLC